MLNFTRLRLTGFKSFVDPSDLRIENGLTGVVGPNGCGKSNVVEALKWVMGETSAKQMRGSEMEDVIFSGTADRPSRNIAEVILTLDNAGRTAPPQFNDTDELEISRRIERDKGSTYRINGKEVRARDVQLLFADQATGARSTALVSQGRVGTVINAKPAQRRMLLEEAAGITGLHSRRHEAELRLRGAETNLERLDDILITLDTQMQSLKKQARQATRYRNLSDHIKKAEATLFYLRWTAAEETRSKARANLREADEAVQEFTRRAGIASTAQAGASEGLPELRQAEASAAAELQRFILAREQVDQNEARAKQRTAELRRQIEQTEQDLVREKQQQADAAGALERLATERGEIEHARAGEADTLDQAGTALADANQAVEEMDRDLNRVTEEVATQTARIQANERRLTEAVNRITRLAERRTAQARELEDLTGASADLVDLAEAETAQEAARTALDHARSAREEAETKRIASDTTLKEKTDDLREATTRATALEAEVRALAQLLETDDDGAGPPVLEAISVTPGFEDALGTALGEDLSAPIADQEDSTLGWSLLPPLTNAPALPEGVQPLADVVKGPDVLARRLSQTGVVASSADGDRLQASLVAGQRLVSKDGGFWRWDGFKVLAGTETAAAKRLAQKNRLVGLRDDLAKAVTNQADKQSAVDAARDANDSAKNSEAQTREAVREADRSYNAARDHLARIKDRAQKVQSRVAALEQALASLATDLEEAQEQKRELEAEKSSFPDIDAAREQVNGLRTTLAERRTHQAEARSRFDLLKSEADTRARRLTAIAQELAMWESRRTGADGRISELSDRRDNLSKELTETEARPDLFQEKRQSALDAIEQAELKRTKAADALATAESALNDADRILKESESALAQARETRVRAEGAVEQAEQACSGLTERIQERLQIRPEGLSRLAEISEGQSLPDMEAAEKRVERLARERDTMGPVNLRAEQEMSELTEQLQTLDQERGDLLAAIEKLRQGINELNREGRARLLESFEQVNGYFKDLFVKLFGGGRAHLELVESDDPLEAGLEIFASPPGKRLQVLSLLSGGEQALTAIALLFAVFQTNPAPICVLDEVDAPLDDANVDRFCKMLEHMSGAGDTRFLVITHHRMTMARMNRLFGVTMQERGVSQLVSVDLQRAEGLKAVG